MSDDVDQLPALQRLLTGKRGNAFALAKVLYRLDRKEEAVTQAAKRLAGYWDYHTTAAARWLGERGREAKAAEPVLRKLLVEQANGARRARLVLTLAQVRGEDGTGAGTSGRRPSRSFGRLRRGTAGGRPNRPGRFLSPA